MGERGENEERKSERRTTDDGEEVRIERGRERKEGNGNRKAKTGRERQKDIGRQEKGRGVEREGSSTSVHGLSYLSMRLSNSITVTPSRLQQT